MELKQGDILKADTEALVNTVNCVGVMGRGIALQFRKAFPANYKAYKAVCDRGELQPGQMFVYSLGRITYPRYIINFPTKKHWRGKSKLSYIETGLRALVQEVKDLGIQSIAIPPLGCGLGGLNWDDVRPMIEQAFQDLPDVEVLLYEPKGAPAADAMVRTQEPPKLTPGRAVLLGLMERYLAGLMDPFLTLIEIHKLMYFAQEDGENLKLRYTKATYGPYAENLRHVLSAIEGHFISGYGDGDDAPEKPIEPKQEALNQALDFLEDHEETKQRFTHVIDLINGFETPFGMELLSTVHWVATREGATDPDRALHLVHSWNHQKRKFEKHHVNVAWNTLVSKGWIGV